jgi:hypothetical protein
MQLDITEAPCSSCCREHRDRPSTDIGSYIENMDFSAFLAKFEHPAL